MSFLHIITIDRPETNRREDGFKIDPVTGALDLVCLVPDFEKASLEKVQEAFAREGSHAMTIFFPAGAGEGFSTNYAAQALIVHMEPPYIQASVTLGEAIIEQPLTYETADNFLELSPELQAVHKYAAQEHEGKLTSMEIIYHLGFKFNSACSDAMLMHKLPALGIKSGKTVERGGFIRVSPALRHPDAFINCLQLSRFLETGEVHFSKRDLRDLLRESDQVYGK